MNAESIITLEEFLTSDYESYEYVKGELVPMSIPTMEHGVISANIVTLLNNYVRQHQLGRVYTALHSKSVKVDENPMRRLFQGLIFLKIYARLALFLQTLQLRLFRQAIKFTMFMKRLWNTWTLEPKWFGCTINTHVRIPYAIGTKAFRRASTSWFTTTGGSTMLSPCGST
jgi:hypothetical protein